VAGGILILSALGLLAGAGWARWLAIVGAAVNAIQQIAFLANYPQAYARMPPATNTIAVVITDPESRRENAAYARTTRAIATRPEPCKPSVSAAPWLGAAARVSGVRECR
jgi:hypothetical protein